MSEKTATMRVNVMITGNSQKLREALEEQLRYWNSHIRNRAEEEMRQRTEAALAAPARNCDLPFADDVARYGAFKAWCNAKGHTMEPKLAYDAFDWLLSTAEKEGGAQ